MDLQPLVAALQGCLSPDQNQRQAAEEWLKQHETAKGQSVNLLRVAAEEQAGAEVRQVASISFKNLVKRSWEPSDGAYQIPAENQQVVRDNLLEIMIRAPHAVQVQLGEVFKMIVYSDYPEKWPGLLQPLLANLVSQEHARVHGALYALRMLTRKFEFRDEEERQPLSDIVNATFPVLLNIFQLLLASPGSSPNVPEYTKLVCKTFWSATYMGIPDILLQQDHFLGWMKCLHSAVTQPIPPEANTESAPAWKAKKWVLHITYRLFNRYCNPKLCKEGNDTKFSEIYVRECMMNFLDAHLSLMAGIAAGQYSTARVTNLVFQYVTHAINVKDMYKHLKPHWDNMLHNVAFPMMCFTDEDAQLWADDPHEYIRKGYDILEDMYSPKTAAANFAYELCSKKKLHLDKFMGLLVQVLNEYQQAAAAGAVMQAVARRMDGALLAVGVMAETLKSKSPYKDQLGPMLVNYVLPCFKSPFGHLRSKACWVSGMYCDIQFPDGKGQGASYGHLFNQVVSGLADPELPVRVDAVVALRHFVEEVEDLDALKPILPQLLSSIFHLMNEVDNEDLVFSLEAIVEKFGEEIAPYALQMTQQLAAAFWKYSAQEEEEEDDDMGSIAAFGCLRALNTLLGSVSSLPDLFPALEEVLFPIMQKMISSDGQDVFEEVLEILAYFTFYSKTISERLWSLWPALHTCLVEWAVDYWENILVPLDNMITRDTARFVNSRNPDYLASVYQMVQYSLTAEVDEHDVLCAPKLLEVVLQACNGQVDHYVAPYIALVLAKLNTVKNRTLKDTLVLVVANALFYNTHLALSGLQAAGALTNFFTLWFTMIFTNKPSGKAKHFRRMHDKKVCVLALVSLLMAPDEVLPPEIKAGLPQALSGIMKLLTHLKEQQDEAEAAAALSSEEEDDEEDSADHDEEEDDNADNDKQAERSEKEQQEYLQRLEKEAKALAEAADEGGDSDDEWTDDEEVEMPIDPIDPFVFFADALASLQSTQPARSMALVSALDPALQQRLQGIMQHAEQQRAKAAAEANKS